VSGIANTITPWDYHQRTWHHLDHYAAGPETLDWDAQPDPFRRYEGCTEIPLALAAASAGGSFGELHRMGAITPAPLNRAGLGRLFELSLGLSAWKQYGPDRWALRCNPSSGNLHPTEGYLVCCALPDLADGVYHYRPDAHLLEHRAEFLPDSSAGVPTALLGLTSIHWREAWKYGERAYRYCQLDAGHAVAALSYAAACLGWRLRPLLQWPDTAVAELLGVDRPTDGAEVEHPDLLLAVETASSGDLADPDPWLKLTAQAVWRGRPNVLDRRPLYQWPVIDAVSHATIKPSTPGFCPASYDVPAVRPAVGDERPAMTVIRARRSAQAYDPAGMMTWEVLASLLGRLLPRVDVPPWSALPEASRLHPLLFVHRVEGLDSGLYALPRSADGQALLRDALDRRFTWDACPAPKFSQDAMLYQLATGDMRRTAGLLCCHQAIAAQASVTFMLLGEWGEDVDAEPWRYRWRHWEAGALGQVLYLHAEAAELRGTGIGCYFDPAVHELLGLSDRRLQSFYHFTIGRPLLDTRIQTLPPYAHLQRA
jgi:SagB-type dehydrogenase family enzyme